MNRFFQSVEARAWTDAEKELDGIRQKAQNASWYKGYVKALEGLLLTYRSGDDKYIYLPRALADRSEESVNQLRKEFGEFASNEIHGEYDRGFFKALEDYVTVLSTLKTPSVAPVSDAEASAKDNLEKVNSAKQGEDLAPYSEESS